MNPDRIYSQYRDDALAKQITASQYSTFVAMPFADRFSYYSRDVYETVIQAAARHANQRAVAPRDFAQPTRADDQPGTARVITEEIVVKILESHLFLADLTFERADVLLEAGIAFGLKPNPQIILITQGKSSDLSFNIRNNVTITYNAEGSVEAIAEAMIAAAGAFEADQEKRVNLITQRLSPDAIICLRRYGEIQQEKQHNSLHAGIAGKIFRGDGRSEARFDAGSLELLHAGLIKTDWKADRDKDYFGMHATKLGWAVITKLWDHLINPRSQDDDS